MADEKPAVPIPQTALRVVEAAWQARLAVLLPGVDPLKPRPSGKFLTEQAAFFAGALSAFAAQGFELPPGWTIMIMSGRNILHERSKPLG